MTTPSLKLLKSEPHQSLSEKLIRTVIFSDDEDKVDSLVARINSRASLVAVDGKNDCSFPRLK